MCCQLVFFRLGADLGAGLGAADPTLLFRGVAVEDVAVEGVTLGRGGESCSR